MARNLLDTLGPSWLFISLPERTFWSRHVWSVFCRRCSSGCCWFICVLCCFSKNALDGWLPVFFWSFLFVMDRGSRSLIDSFLYLWTTMGTVTLLHAALASNWRARTGWILATIGCLGYGCLVKGPVALLIPIFGALGIGWAWKGRSGVSFTAILVGAIGGGLVTLGWLLLASHQVGDWYFERLFYKQSAGRAVQSFHHAKPVWYYVGAILPVALPWVVFLPGAVHSTWTKRTESASKAALGVWVWAGLIFVFFSLISGKRTGYLLPMFPALALGIAFGISQMANTRARVLCRWPLWGMTGLTIGIGVTIAVAALVLWIAPFDFNTDDVRGLEWISSIPYNGLAVLVIAGISVSATGVWVATVLCRHANLPIVVAGLVLVIAGAFAAVHLSVIPAMDPERSAATFGAQIDATWNRNERLVVLHTQKDGIVNYYCNTQSNEIVKNEELPAILGPLWVVSLQKDWDRQPKDFRAQFLQRGSGQFNNKKLVLMHRKSSD